MNTLNDYIGEYLDFCRHRKRLNLNTMKAYRIDLRQYESFCTGFADFNCEFKSPFHYLEYKELLDGISY